MKLLALHGMAGAGKDTFADRLVERHGFVKRGFADPLYEEVAAAYKVDAAWLRDRTRKECAQPELMLNLCYDDGFRYFMYERGTAPTLALSPRFVLEHWGTDYRRGPGGHDRYWLDQMAAFCEAQRGNYDVRGVAINDCRFTNEAAWVHFNGGHVAHIIRPGLTAVSGHVSALPLHSKLIDSIVLNTGGISYLHDVADSAPYSGHDTAADDLHAAA